MPIFEYCCLNCGETFERLVLTGRQEASMECPECGSTDVEKIYSVFSGRTGKKSTTSCSLSSST